MRADVLLRRAQLLLALGHNEEAINDLLSVGRTTRSGWAAIALAQCVVYYAGLGRHADAALVAKRLVRRFPDDEAGEITVRIALHAAVRGGDEKLAKELRSLVQRVQARKKNSRSKSDD
jgi:hypothetical protein